MTVNAFERWGSWLVNMGLFEEYDIDGSDVLLRCEAIAQVRIPGIAAKFTARYSTGTAVALGTMVIQISPARWINAARWLACDVSHAVLYDAGARLEIIDGAKLAAAQALLSSLPDQLA